MQAGHAAILSQIGSSDPPATGSNSSSLDRGWEQRQQMHTTRPSSRKFRFTLPRWFTETVWEFATYDLGDGRVFEVCPIDIRPSTTPAFDAVRFGNVGAVRKLLASGDLSASDYEYSRNREPKALLTIAAESGRLELCEFLLQEFPRYCHDADLLNALNAYLNYYWPSASHESFDHVTEEFYKLFIGKHGLQTDIQELAENRNSTTRTIVSEKEIIYNERLTKATLQEILTSQPISIDSWSIAQNFSVAVGSRDWYPATFVEMVRPDSLTELAALQDSCGRTALHWTAEHFARRNYELDPYAELARELIAMAADL